MIKKLYFPIHIFAAITPATAITTITTKQVVVK